MHFPGPIQPYFHSKNALLDTSVLQDLQNARSLKVQISSGKPLDSLGAITEKTCIQRLLILPISRVALAEGPPQMSQTDIVGCMWRGSLGDMRIQSHKGFVCDSQYL